jgi:hypothetical protein
MNNTLSFWRTWPGFCAIMLLAALLFFLVTEHTAHFFGVLPYAIFLICPLLHIFMHRGHGGHKGDSGDQHSSTTDDTQEEHNHGS